MTHTSRSPLTLLRLYVQPTGQVKLSPGLRFAIPNPFHCDRWKRTKAEPETQRAVCSWAISSCRYVPSYPISTRLT